MSSGRRASFEDTKTRRKNMELSNHENTIFDENPALRLHAACLKNNEELVRYLIDEEGEDVNTRVPKNFVEMRRRLSTPLIISARQGNTKILKLLLKRGANANDVSQGGASALYIACQEGHSECVAALIKYGANLNQQEYSRNAPPLFAAAQFNNVECVKLLTKAGCDVTIKTKTGSTAIVVAAQEGYADVVVHLLPTSFEQLFKSMYLTSSHDRVEALRILVESADTMYKSSNPNRFAFLLQKCLEPATKARSVRCLRVLTSQQVKLDQGKLDDAVRFATTEGYIECMRILIDAGASVKVAKKIARQTGREDYLDILKNSEKKKGLIKGGASKLKKWFRRQRKGSKQTDGLVISTTSPPTSPTRRHVSSPKVRRASLAGVKRRGSPSRSRALTPIGVTVRQNAVDDRNDDDVHTRKTRNVKAPMSPSLGDLLDLRDEVMSSASISSPTRTTPISPSIRRASLASAKKKKSFRDFDPFADLFPVGGGGGEVKDKDTVSDPFATTSPIHIKSPLSRFPISPRVRRASMNAKGRRASFKDLAVAIPTSPEKMNNKNKNKKTAPASPSLSDLLSGDVSPKTMSRKESSSFDPFSDLFPDTTLKMKNPRPVSPRVRRASMNARRRQNQEKKRESYGDEDEEDEEEVFHHRSNDAITSGPSPRTRTRNEYYNARKTYKQKKREFYRNRNLSDTEKRSKLEREAIKAKKILEDAKKRMSFHNVENKDNFDEFDMEGL